jgi:hypothetical protein
MEISIPTNMVKTIPKNIALTLWFILNLKTQEVVK